MHALRNVAVAALACHVAADTPGAEVVRVEREGTVLAEEDSGDLRQAAMHDGIRGAVIDIAAQLVGIGPEESTRSVRRALGSQLLSYTERFQIVEDRGSGPRLSEDGEATGETEYVVVIEVFIDEERVRRRLLEAGILASEPPAPPPDRLLLEVRGVESYATLEKLEAALLASPDVSSVVPREFAPGRLLLAVETRESGERLRDRLVVTDPHWAVWAIPSEGSALVIGIDERP